MISNSDIRKLRAIFVTKEDLREFGENILKGIGELFNATNERIDGSNNRIDKVLLKLEEHDGDLNNHKRRIEKLEEKAISV